MVGQLKSILKSSLFFAGFSDPYIVVKYGNQEMYRTHHVNKTLNPQWNCQVTLSAPPPDVPMVIVSH